jgi:hypothetical protein
MGVLNGRGGMIGRAWNWSINTVQLFPTTLGQHYELTAAAWATNGVQYAQDGNDLLHFFFRVLQITHAWAA